MNPMLQKIEYDSDISFGIREEREAYSYNRWHYHPEIELTLIKKGSGTRLVGDSIESFSEGYLILLGANLPHFWRFGPDHFVRDKPSDIEAVSIYFKDDFWGRNFLSIPEMKNIKEVLLRAKRGIKIQGKAKEETAALMERMLAVKDADRVILLLQMLNILGDCPECPTLSIIGSADHTEYDHTDAISRIYSYTLTHFPEKIEMRKLSSIVNVSPHSFRRYFKSRTGKTYWQFLLDVRVGHACKLLMENKYTVSQICFSCGFNNLSNFNRRFKEKMGVTPSCYTKKKGTKRIEGD